MQLNTETRKNAAGVEDELVWGGGGRRTKAATTLTEGGIRQERGRSIQSFFLRGKEPEKALQPIAQMVSGTPVR